jgi:microcystin-dependent protein
VSTSPFIAEIQCFAFDFAPKGWAQCNGQFVPIAQNQALFALLGTTFGGNGQTTFQLPDMRNRVPNHFGGGFTLGTRGGEDAHTLTLGEMPAHTHVLNASSLDGDTQAPSNRVFARTTNNIYATPASLAALLAATTSSVGGGQPHENRQPYIKMNWCIALQGTFPSRN